MDRNRRELLKVLAGVHAAATLGTTVAATAATTQLDDLRTSPEGKGERPVRSDTPITWEEEIQW